MLSNNNHEMRTSMKTMQRGLFAFFITLLSYSAQSVAAEFASYDEAVQDANTAIDKAKSKSYEWRDTRKMMTKAEKLNASGKTDEALKVVAKAKQQAVLAVVQAKSEAGRVGPR